MGGYDSRTAFPKYLEYFGKLVPTKMKPLYLPHICRGNPDKFGQAVLRKYKAVTSSRSSPDQFSEISGIFRKSDPGKRAQVRRASFTLSFYRENKYKAIIFSKSNLNQFIEKYQKTCANTTSKFLNFVL